MSDLYTEFLAFTESWMVRREMMRPAPAPRPVREPTPRPPLSMDVYRRALRQHDWWYVMADGATYRAGRDSYSRLCLMQSAIDPNGSVWNEYAPEGHRITVGMPE